MAENALLFAGSILALRLAAPYGHGNHCTPPPLASSHGFKDGSVMGDMVADAALGAKIPPTEMGLAPLLGITPG